MASIVTKTIARKDFQDQGILKGQEIYTWLDPSTGRTRRSLTPPKASETCSLGSRELYQAIESLETFDWTNFPGFTDAVQSAVDDIRSRYDELPPGFQSGPSGERMLEWIRMGEEIIDLFSDLEPNVSGIEEDEGLEPEEKSERLQDMWSDVVAEVSGLMI